MNFVPSDASRKGKKKERALRRKRKKSLQRGRGDESDPQWEMRENLPLGTRRENQDEAETKKEASLIAKKKKKRLQWDKRREEADFQ